MNFFRTPISLLVVFFALVSAALATSDTTAIATKGTLTQNSSGAFTFQFSGQGFQVTSLSAEDVGGWINYAGGATLQDLAQDSTLFFTVPLGFMTYNGQQYQWMGQVQFAVGSFHYSFDKNGNLTVWGIANQAGSSVTPCDANQCINITGPTISFGGTWHYKASFLNSGTPGTYYFNSMTISTTPEPSSIVLAASGLIAIGACKLRQLVRS